MSPSIDESFHRCGRCKGWFMPDTDDKPDGPTIGRHFCRGVRSIVVTGDCPSCGRRLKLVEGFIEPHYPRLPPANRTSYEEVWPLCQRERVLPAELAAVLWAIADLGSPVEG